APAATAAAFVPTASLGEMPAQPHPEPPPPWDRWAPPRPGHGSIWHHPARKPANLPVLRPPAPVEHDLYLPGVGFRGPGGMASRGPVSAAAGGLSLTVHRVTVLDEGTWLDVEVSGVAPGPGSRRSIGFEVTLRADGQTHAAAADLNRTSDSWDDGRLTVRTVAHLG